MKKLFFVLFLIGCADRSSLSPNTPDPLAVMHLKQAVANNKPVVIGIIGNSIGCGYDATNARAQIVLQGNGLMTQAFEDNSAIGGWAQQLQVWLRAKNSQSKVWNLSGSGWTTQDTLDRDTMGLMASQNPKPTVVFIPLQVNDRYKAGNTGPGADAVTFDQFKANTVLLIKSAISHGMTPVLVKEENEPFPASAGWAMVNPAAPVGGFHAFSEYMAAIDTIGEQYAIEVIDTYTPSLRNPATTPQYAYNGSLAPVNYDSTLMDVVEPWGFNGIHPNQKGHNLIFSQYVKWLKG